MKTAPWDVSKIRHCEAPLGAMAGYGLPRWLKILLAMTFIEALHHREHSVALLHKEWYK